MVLRQRDRRIGAVAEATLTGTAPSCRLDVVFAEDSRKAVIFRRGPSRSTRLITWDRATDTFEPGQWMQRASVYPERASLSPDGEYLLSFIGKFRPPFHAYTVLSRPPYFTALALWPIDDTWGGGGTFVGPREFVLQHDDPEPLLAPGFTWPSKFVVHTSGPAGRARLESWRKSRKDWQPRERTADRWSFVKKAGDAKLIAGGRRVRRVAAWDYELQMRARSVFLPSCTQWADFDGDDIVFSAGGKLDRLSAASFADATAQRDVAPFARRLADFSDMRFESVEAPYATGGVYVPGTGAGWPDEQAGAFAPGSGAGSPDEQAGAFAPKLDRVSKEDRRRRRADRKAAQLSSGKA